MRAAMKSFLEMNQRARDAWETSGAGDVPNGKTTLKKVVSDCVRMWWQSKEIWKGYCFVTMNAIGSLVDNT